MRRYNERLGYGPFEGDGPDHCYTEQEAREQDEYLRRRNV